MVTISRNQNSYVTLCYAYSSSSWAPSFPTPSMTEMMINDAQTRRSASIYLICLLAKELDKAESHGAILNPEAGIA